jgi:ribosomal protein L11 methylase PrmA
MFGPIGIIIFVMFVVFVVGMAYLIQGPPYVPSNDENARKIVAMVKGCKPRRVLDMGSGDGKLVIMLAKQGYTVDGVELNPYLVWRSQRAIKKAGLADTASVKWGNFWKFDVSGYDVIALYAIKHIMPRLEKKLMTELRSGSHIVSNSFVFPNLKPSKRAGPVRSYKIP